MRSVFASCLLLLCHLTAVAADPAADTFQVTNYKLAFVNVGPEGAVTNEYVPRGETLETWTSLIGVRQWPKVEKLSDITGPYVKALHPLLVREAKVYQPEGDSEDTNVIFELYLAPADKSYLEYNLIRFTREEGSEGVKSYQYALKGEYDLDAAVAVNSPQLKSRLEVLRTLKLEAYQEMNDDSSATTTETPTASSNATTRTKTRTTSTESNLYPSDTIQVLEETTTQEAVVEETTVTDESAPSDHENASSDEQGDDSDSDSDSDSDDDEDADDDSDDDDSEDEDEDDEDDSDEDEDSDDDSDSDDDADDDSGDDE